MTELRLPDLRIGFNYAVDLNFPSGFLTTPERVRAALRRYPGQATPDAIFTDSRVGNTITLELTAVQTASLEPGTYLSEAVIYVPGQPAAGEIVLVDNQFRIEANYSPSAAAAAVALET
jgi:hypothetical protein